MAWTARSSGRSRTSTGSAENEVFVVGGGPYGSFDLPAVRAFIRIFAPRRGEIVVDAEALDLQPPKTRPPGEDRPRAPRRTSRRPKRVDGTALEGAPEVAPDEPEGAAPDASPPTADEPPA